MANVTRETLLEQRDKLRQRMQAIKNDIRGGLDADSSEQAVQLQNADVLNEITRVTEEELARIEALLSKQHSLS